MTIDKFVLPKGVTVGSPDQTTVTVIDGDRKYKTVLYTYLNVNAQPVI